MSAFIKAVDTLDFQKYLQDNKPLLAGLKWYENPVAIGKAHNDYLQEQQKENNRIALALSISSVGDSNEKN